MEKRKNLRKRAVMTALVSIVLTVIVAVSGSMSAFAASLKLGRSSWYPSAASQSISVTVTASSSSWTCSKSASWISVGRSGSSSMRISVTANTTGSARSGRVYVKVGTLSKSVYVSQKANSLSVTAPSSTAYSAPGGSKTITASAACGSYSVSDNASWITTSKSGSKVTVKAAANTTGATRTGRVTITSGSLSKSVTFTQSPYTCTLGTYEVSAGTIASTYPVNVTSSYSSWTVTANNTWLSATRSGSSFTIAVNTNTGAARTGTVTVNAGGTKRTVTVKQAANKLVVNNGGSLLFEVVPSKNSLSVPVSCASKQYTATSNASWATVTKTSTGITINIAKNTTTAWTKKRTATITVKSGIFESAVVINQTSFKAYLEEKSSDISAKKTVGYVEFLTDDWDTVVTTSDDWLSVEIDYIDDTGVDELPYMCLICYTAEANTDTEPRTGAITIRAGGNTKVFNVIQAGAAA